MIDAQHLNALNLNRSHERMRLHLATNPKEREMRTVWIAGLDREIAGERAFLGLPPETAIDLDDDALLRELTE